MREVMMGIVGLDGNGVMVRGITRGLCEMNTVWEFYLAHCHAAFQPLSPCVSLAPGSALKDNLLRKHRAKQIPEAQIHISPCSISARTELLPSDKCLSSICWFWCVKESLSRVSIL